MKNNMVIVVVLLLVVGGGGFFAGMKYQEGKQPASSSQAGRFQGQRGGNRNGLGSVSGEILSVDDKTMSVKLQDGSSKIVILSQTTTYSKAVSGTRDDLKVGERVVAFGQGNSDGSVTAQNVQINPIFRGGMNGQIPGST